MHQQTGLGMEGKSLDCKGMAGVAREYGCASLDTDGGWGLQSTKEAEGCWTDIAQVAQTLLLEEGVGGCTAARGAGLGVWKRGWGGSKQRLGCGGK